MKTIKIKGKDYITVNERVKEFRSAEKYKGWALVSTITELTNEHCTIKAAIYDENGQIKATGFAREEKENKLSMVNKTSYVENCETSAWGRALGNLGIGIDTSIASAEEVVNAIASQLDVQKKEQDPKLLLLSLAKNRPDYKEKILLILEKKYGGKTSKDLTTEECRVILKEIKNEDNTEIFEE